RFVGGKGRLVNQQICPSGSFDGVTRRAGVAGVDDQTPGAGGADDLRRRHDTPLHLHRLSVVELSPERTLGNSQFPRPLRVETAEPRVLPDRITQTARAVGGAEWNDVVLTP